MWDRRRPTGKWAVRTALLLAMVIVAGTMLFVLPEPDGDPVTEVYALQADRDPDAPTTDQPAENETPDSTFQVSDAIGTRSSQGWLAAMSGSEAAANLNVVANLARRTTTAPPTTEVTTTTTNPTTTGPPTEVAPIGAAQTTAETSASTAAETTESTEGVEPNEEAAQPVESTDSTELAESADTTEAALEETTTTTAPPTTAADNGFVDAGHGVYVPPILLKIRWCESRDDYTAANPSSSARGAYQFLTGSWSAYGHASRYGVSQAHLATPAQQDEAALITWQRDGTRPWLASKHCWA
ncbi:MAG: transglycosylase family protein [Acidimicrobiia bacterium]|nr:transglycosylase family protein [Acidimicrobiia bacterium]